MTKSTFRNIFILGLSGIIAKSFDFIFRVYYSRVLGAEGMGLLSLGFSVHGVMLTFATAGLGVAVSKITSEYMEKKDARAVAACMRTALFGVTLLSLLVMLIAFLFSPAVSENMLGDTRMRLSLYTLSPSVLFMGISYCLKGYFYAARKIIPPASSEILEQIVKFISIKGFLKMLLPFGIEYGCAAIFLGISVGELSSCAYLLFFYKKEGNKSARSTKELVFKLLGISIPAMVTSLCCSSLSVREEVLLLSAFNRGGINHSKALESLGILKGMVMPQLILPLSLCGSVMSLLIPEISRADIRGNLLRTLKKVYSIGLIIGILVGLFFIIFGNLITNLIYKNDAAARLVVSLAPLCPIMFIDSLSCNILNGLGKQLKMLVFTICDFCLRFIIIYFLVPKFGFSAFCVMVYLSNIFTCALSFLSILFTSRFRLTKPLKYGMLKK